MDLFSLMIVLGIAIAIIGSAWVAGAIEGFIGGTGANSVTHGVSFATQRSANLAVQLNAQGNFNVSTNYTYGTTGAGTYNQISQGPVQTIGTSGTLNLLLSAPSGFIDTEAGASPTFSALRYIRIELLDTTQGGGANASSITIGNAASNAWVSTTNCPFTGTNVVKIFSGQKLVIEDPDSTGGMVVTASSADQLKILNNDGSNAASVRITLLGYK